MASEWHKRQKSKGVRLELTWFPARKCWKKFKQGKVYYFHHPNSAEGYGRALAEWHAVLQSQDDNRPWVAEYTHHLKLLARCLEWCDRYGVPDGEKAIDEELRKVIRQIEDILKSGELPCPSVLIPVGNGVQDGLTVEQVHFINEFAPMHVDDDYLNDPLRSLDRRFGAIGYQLPDRWAERVAQFEREPDEGRQPMTVGYWAEEFLGVKLDQAAGDVRSPRTAKDARQRLKKFRDWFGDNMQVNRIDEATVDGYYRYLLRTTASATTKGTYFNAARSFIRWLWRQGKIETLPRTLDDPTYSFLTSKRNSTQSHSEKLWTKTDFECLLKSNLRDHWKAWILLMANTGYTQKDLSDLEHEELHLNECRIIRGRSKRKRATNPLLVNIKLWPVTCDYLKKTMTAEGDYVFRMSRGSRLVVSKVVQQVDGTTKIVQYDNVSRNWQRVRSATGLNKQLKYIRKSVSTALKYSPHKGMREILLGHESSIAAQHYDVDGGQVDPDLDAAIDYLGEHFGLLQRMESQAPSKTSSR